MWKLSIDVLVFDELHASQLPLASIGLHKALTDLALPQVVATMNQNTNELEIDLRETIFTEEEGADNFSQLDTSKLPLIFELGIYKDKVVLDMSLEERECVNQ